MITLKLWNELAQVTRSEICRIIGVSGQIEKEYHHNFDFDSLGRRLKSVLEHCNLQKDGKINVTISVVPVVEKNKPKEKPATRKQQTTDVYVNAIKQGVRSAVNILPEILKKYGGKDKSLQVSTVAGWNFRIKGFHIYKGKACCDIYWQGDDIDGDDSFYVNDVLNAPRETYTIKATPSFDGYRTRFDHDDIHIDSDDLYNGLKALIPVIEGMSSCK